MCLKVKVTLCNPVGSPGLNTGVGSLSLLHGIFPTKGLNPGLPHCGWILYQLRCHEALNGLNECNVLRMVLGISSDAAWVMDILLLLLYEDVWLLYEGSIRSYKGTCSLYKHFLKHGSLGLPLYLFIKRKQSHVIMSSWLLALVQGPHGDLERGRFQAPSNQWLNPHSGWPFTAMYTVDSVLPPCWKKNHKSEFSYEISWLFRWLPKCKIAGWGKHTSCAGLLALVSDLRGPPPHLLEWGPRAPEECGMNGR